MDRPVVFILSPLLSIMFNENSKNTRNELARPVMGTIFLVSIHLQVQDQLHNPAYLHMQVGGGE